MMLQTTSMATAPATSEPSLPLLPLPSRPEMERAYQASDASYDGVFYLGVRTTGIFCRPSCPARKPKPENVEFFGLAEGRAVCRLPAVPAVQAARERPGAAVGEPAARADRAAAGRAHPRGRPADDGHRARAACAGTFDASYGLTFQAYCRARRLARAFERIRDGEALDDAVFETGYESHSGFRDAFQKAFGQPPGKSASAECIRLTWIDTPLGPMIAGATDKGLCLLEFTDRRMLEHQLSTLRRRFKAALVPADHPHLTTLRKELAEYFAGTRETFTMPLDAPGTPFEERVWQALLRIPYGETRSYEDIAREVGSARSRPRRRPRQRHEPDRDRHPVPPRA